MFTNALVALAAVSFVGQAVAAGAHHAHQQLHMKRAYVTEVVTVTEWETVYAQGTKVYYAPTRKAKTTSTSSTSTSSSSSAAPPPPPPPAAVPTTLATVSKPATTEQAAPTPEVSVPAPEAVKAPVVSEPAPVVSQPAPVVSQPAPVASQPAANPPANGGGTAGKPQRGLAYNHANLLKGFLGQNSKVTWTYNWGQVDDSDSGLEFVPMLWGNREDWFVKDWNKNAQKAIDAGSKCLLSFNEPDFPSQANMSPALAAQEHKRLMNPWSSKARIGSPAITSSTSQGMGIDWMKQFLAACAGQCAVDFIVAHSYGHDGKGFLAHLVDVHEAFNKPVWVTEFAFPGSVDKINEDLAFVIKELETNPKYSFVERYAYFMAAEGSMVSGNAPNKYGNTFAYSS